MSEWILKIFFNEQYQRLRDFERVRKQVCDMFPEYRPYVCGETFTSTMHSADPVEILDCVRKGIKRRGE